MATHGTEQLDTGRLLRRVLRDLDAPMALLVSTHPQDRMAAHSAQDRMVAHNAQDRMVAHNAQCRVVAHRGFDSDRLVTELLSVQSAQRRGAGTGRDGAPGFLSWAAAPVLLDEVEVGTLLVADRRRRWFDDEEVRHLGLLGFSAGPMITATTVAIDVRDHQPAVAALA